MRHQTSCGCHAAKTCVDGGCACCIAAAGAKTDADYARVLFRLAKRAKKDVLKDKMKHHIEIKMGHHLDRLAELAADAVIDQMQRKAAKARAKAQYKETIADVMSDLVP